MKRSGDYDTIVNYHGFGVDDYHYIGGRNHQDSRFSNASCQIFKVVLAIVQIREVV